MGKQDFVREIHIDAAREDVWNWYIRNGAFTRLAPSWDAINEVEGAPGVDVGIRRVFRFPLGPFRPRWIAKHTECEEGEMFAERMIRGPFKQWEHTHRFVEREDGGCTIRDEVAYRVPLAGLGQLVAGRSVRKRIERMFRSRELRVKTDLARHNMFSATKKILVSGSTGLIGLQLCAFLSTGGHEVFHLVRPSTKRGTIPEHLCIEWDPKNGHLEMEDLQGFDAVIHLAGAGIGEKRWSKKRKEEILKSRKTGTELLANAIASLDQPPEAFLIANAIGWYGNRGDEELDEGSERGQGFLSDVCKIWMEAADAASKAGIRTIFTHFGIVLAARGGALGKMLFPFKMGAGGRVGSGKQWFSWISLDDTVYAIHHLLMSEDCEGRYNLTAPEPVPQKAFAKQLGSVLRRPTIAPLPGFAVRALFGQMGGALLLEGQRVRPKRLLDSGFRHHHPSLESALRDELGIWNK